jgi:PucR C-terminal helix-turn-helix domain
MMLGATELLRIWVGGTLTGLAADDEDHARLRDTLLVFLEAGGSYKATAEKLMLHKNSVQYRIRKAEEWLGRPASQHRPDLELALRVSRWLGSYVLRPAAPDRGQPPGAQPRTPGQPPGKLVKQVACSGPDPLRARPDQARCARRTAQRRGRRR